MSVKSLLQLILLLLIFLIIGGIYFLYFYSGTIKTTINDEIVIDQNNERLISENLSRNDGRCTVEMVGVVLNKEEGR